MQAQNINEVISRLEAIIGDAIKTNCRAGYFAALYYKVTCRVRDGILAGEFENGPRMEQFDVLFANRYLAAYDEWAGGTAVASTSWKIAFDALGSADVLVLQHLLLGMNAHINLDLGVAVVETARALGQPLDSLHNDFNTINTILAALTYQVISELDEVSPLMSLAGLHSGNDSLLIQFAMDNARDGAWCFAGDLSATTGDAYTTCLTQRDTAICSLGKTIVKVKGLLRLTVLVIYLFSMKNASRIVGILHGGRKKKLRVS